MHGDFAILDSRTVVRVITCKMQDLALVFLTPSHRQPASTRSRGERSPELRRPACSGRCQKR